ncbi:MAG: NADH-quinone oxidoreductase subunit NuoE [Candidatus Cloacimonadota bacterium]|jgi:NADH-quinone oxidoreductase subunit E/NADP-reducing hydrogenase subunit HndA|nr:MAG: NADH-quinone oxidoreductase subunit NuoE [Candidatus Cloacimonadota bacterium]
MTTDSGKNNMLYEKLKEVIVEKKQLRNPLIEILREAQDIFGYLPSEVQKFVAEELRIPLSQVYGVVSFYNFFTMKPRGKHIINVCTGTACFVKGAPKLLQMLEEELNVKLGETTEDKMFTLTSVRCVGACSLAPVVVIGEETYGRVDSRKKVKEIINKYQS